MNENLNLVDILKDCPKGTKLYSSIFGCVNFEYIENEEITVTNNISGDTETFNKNGSWYYGYTNECILFPSKDQRDWSKFSIEPKFDIKTLKPFDKVLVRDFDDGIWKCNFYEKFEGDKDYPFITMRGPYKQCIPYNKNTKHLVDTKEMPQKKYINWEE